MRVIFYGLCLGLLLYEGAALTNEKEDDTISEIFWEASKRPLVPFAFGMLCGHFFWQRLAEIKRFMDRKGAANG